MLPLSETPDLLGPVFSRTRGTTWERNGLDAIGGDGDVGGGDGAFGDEGIVADDFEAVADGAGADLGHGDLAGVEGNAVKASAGDGDKGEVEPVHGFHWGKRQRS